MLPATVLADISEAADLRTYRGLRAGPIRAASRERSTAASAT